MSDRSVNGVTDLLRAWKAGDDKASDMVATLVYDELHRQAALSLRHEGDGHTLQTTGLVHEAWLRLDTQRDVQWENRVHFFAVAARMMRRVLVDHARQRHTVKRGSAPVQVSLGAGERGGSVQSALDPVDLLALDDALARLMAVDERKARLVELRYFAGLTMPEAAEALDISLATAGREWAVARTWLRRELEP